jgi:hypothetical protein
MNLDLRWPLGLLFLLLGGILVLHGLTVGTRVLGFNVNLVWGAVMMVFGGIALGLARQKTSR